MILECGVVLCEHDSLLMGNITEGDTARGNLLMWFLEMVVKLVTGQSMNHCHTFRATPERETSINFDCVLLWN